jgi:hypothetical protein
MVIRHIHTSCAICVSRGGVVATVGDGRFQKVVYWWIIIVAIFYPLRSGASDEMYWRSMYMPEIHQVEAVLKELAKQTPVDWPREGPHLHLLTEFQNANAMAGGGCYTESEHAGHTYRVEQPPMIFVTVGLLHVLRTFAGDTFVKFVMAHEMAHLERRLSAHPSLNCAADVAAYENGGSVKEELRADHRGVELLCLLGEDGVAIGLEGIDVLYRFNLGLKGHRAYPSREQRLEQMRSLSCFNVAKAPNEAFRNAQHLSSTTVAVCATSACEKSRSARAAARVVIPLKAYTRKPRWFAAMASGRGPRRCG